MNNEIENILNAKGFTYEHIGGFDLNAYNGKQSVSIRYGNDICLTISSDFNKETEEFNNCDTYTFGMYEYDKLCEFVKNYNF